MIPLLLFASMLVQAGSQGPLATVQALMDGMAAHDAAKIKSLFTPDGRLILVAGDKIVFNVTGEEFAQRVSGGKDEILERLRNPKVDIRGSIASVWSEYDFLRAGKLNHCGIDAFLLLKTDEGWKIFSAESTVEKEGCPAS
jgi:hypothetical protein